MQIYGKVYVCVRCVYTYLHALADIWAHVHTILSWLVGRRTNARGRGSRGPIVISISQAVAARVTDWSRGDQLVTRSRIA